MRAGSEVVERVIVRGRSEVVESGRLWEAVLDYI